MKNDITQQKGLNRQKKEAIVSEIAQKAARAKAVVLTNYQGLTHQQLEKLKKRLITQDAELVVSKNSLLKLALKKAETKQEINFDQAVGPTATLFAYGDIIGPLKELAKSIKDFKLPSVKIGIVENRLVNGEEVARLATLPSKEVLIAQFVFGLKSPLLGLHRALQWNIQKLVLTLGAVQSKKSA